MTTIHNMQPQAFGEQLERLSNLSGIPLPPDPKGTLHYVREQYGKYYSTLVSDAIDWYLQGFMEDRARSVNAMFVIKIFRAYLKASPRGNMYYPKKKYTQPERTPQELAEIDRKAMSYVAEAYYNVKYNSGQFKLHMKSVESLYDYAMKFGKELDFDQLEYWEQWIKTYLERKNNYSEQERLVNTPLRALGYERTNDHVDYFKCAHVLQVIQKRIDDGWTP